MNELYTAWISEPSYGNKSPDILVAGAGPPRWINGTIMYKNARYVCSFFVENWGAALEQYRKYKGDAVSKRALITGVNGQDGSYLAEYLLNKNYEVFGLVRRSSQNNLSNLNSALSHQNFYLISGDMTDTSSLLKSLHISKPDEIYNLAAQSDVRISFDQPTYTFDVTATAAINLFDLARQIVPSARIYQASSSEMFGNSIDSDGFQRETTPFAPRSPYAVAKLAAHQAAATYRESYRQFISCGILFNHESERRGENFVTRKITKYCGELYQALRRKYPDQYYRIGDHHDHALNYPPLELGDVNSSRDWGYAPDYVEAMWLMLQTDAPDDFVIATGKSCTVYQFLERAFRVINVRDYREYVTTNSALFRPTEVKNLRGDYSKASKLLGWRPRTDFDSLVRTMVQHEAGA